MPTEVPRDHSTNGFPHIVAVIPMSSQAVSLRGVHKRFTVGRSKEVVALDGVDLHVNAGECVALVGPSGCGKSTILRLIASLEAPTSGEVTIQGRPPADLVKGHRLGVAFQDHALLPWLRAWDNVALPYRLAKRPVDKQRVDRLLSLVGLAGFERMFPKQLSGGMRQRVAIARALTLDPDLLLLDEPFAAVDAVTRRRLTIDLQNIISELGITTVHVTHLVEEAVFVADRVVVMTSAPGRIQTEHTIDFPRPRAADLLRERDFHDVVDAIGLSLDQ